MNTITTQVVSTVTLVLVTGLAHRSAAGIFESFWNLPGDGNFHDPANWNGPVPDETVTAIFDQDAEYYVVFLEAGAVTDRIVVRDGHVHLWLSNFDGSEPRSYETLNPSFLTPSIVVGDNASGDPTLTIVGGALSGEFMVIGLNPGSQGTVDFTSYNELVPSLVEQWQIHVGMQGTGVLNVAGPGEVACHDALLGSLSSGAGEVIVTGDGAHLDCTGTLSVGKGGQGVLAVEESGEVQCAHAIVGQQFGSVGEVSVTGLGSILVVSQSLDVGFRGQGTLAILDGGLLLSEGYAAIGSFSSDESEGVGEATVSGPASIWINDGVLYVGYQGSGTLNVLDGATVTAQEGYVAYGYGSFLSLATIDGPGSVWALVDELTVYSTLIVSDGALVIADTIEINGNLEGDGTLEATVVETHGTTSPGHPFGTLTVTGDFSQAIVSPHYLPALSIELAGTGPDQFDSLAVSETASLQGLLTVSLADGFTPSAGDSFTIVSAGNLVGQTGFVKLPPLGPSLTWRLIQDETELVLLVTKTADLNGDGAVGILDFLALLLAWGPCSNPQACAADLDGDGSVGLADFLLLLSAWS